MRNISNRLFPDLTGWRRLALFVGLWTVVGLFQATRLYFIYNFSDSFLISWGQSVVWALSEWYLWGLFSLIIVRIVFAAPITRRNWVSRVALHIAGAVVISLAQLLCYTAVYLLTSDLFYHQVGSSITGFWPTYVSLVTGKFHSAVFTYFLIAGIAYALVYAREFREEQLRRVRTQSELTRARLETLKGQLQPHFLFNTLNAISALVHSDPDRADAMIARLSDLLRTSLQDDGVQTIPLAAELEFTQKFLEIQQMRFAERLQVRFEIDDRSRDALVPGLLLQPLVENAVKHGITSQPDGGTVTVSSTVQGDRLLLVVSDDGPGLNPDAAQSGLGLENTRRRLAELYGEACSFELREPKSGGLTVAIRLPLEAGPDVNRPEVTS